MEKEITPENDIVEPISGITIEGNKVLSMNGFIKPVEDEILHLMDGVSFDITRMLCEGFGGSNTTQVLKINTEDGYTMCISGDQLVPTRDRGDVIGYELTEEDSVLLYNATLLDFKETLSKDKNDKIKQIVDEVIEKGELTTDDITGNVILEINSSNIYDLQLNLLEIGIKSSHYKSLVVNGTHLSRLMDLIGLYNPMLLDIYNEQVKEHGLDPRFNEFSSKIGTIEYLGVSTVVEPKNHHFDLTYVCNGILIKK